MDGIEGLIATNESHKTRVADVSKGVSNASLADELVDGGIFEHLRGNVLIDFGSALKKTATAGGSWLISDVSLGGNPPPHNHHH